MTFADILTTEITPRRIVLTIVWIWISVLIWKALRPDFTISVYATLRLRIYGKLRARCFEITALLTILGSAALFAGLDHVMKNVTTLEDFASMAQDPEFFHLLGLAILIGFTILVIAWINDCLDKITLHTSSSLARCSVLSLVCVFAAGFIAVQLAGYSDGIFT